ncbi:MAG TPA: TonB-dependent receptor [Draconibacterium sp.]|nr:TonB-dependent receptor [Draconibacterium sp.]
MRKLTFLLASFMLTNFVFAGGLLTNTNQSAQFIRMMSRNASLDIDAVYYNPAGLIKLEDGWHFGVYSQTILQDKNVNCGFPLLNDPNYLGKVSVPVFPTGFAVYKKDNWAFSFGFGPNAGGGSAEFERGLPSFEIPISKVVPGLAGLKQISPTMEVTGYDADLSFTGSSIFWGFQLGATYEINDMLSVYGGARYMPSKNVYQGSIKNIQLEVAGNLTPASAWLTQTAGTVDMMASVAYAGANSVQPIIDNGGGSYTLNQLEQYQIITPTQKAQLEGGLKAMGVPQENIAVMNITQVQGAYNLAGNQLTGVAASLDGTASQLGDKEVDTEQTGAGITPIIGINFSPNEDWNIGIKYEHKTYMTLTNNTTVDDLGLFPDDQESASDVPGILGIGVGYKGFNRLEAQVSYTYYFNKNVDWGMNVRDLSSWKSVDPTKIRHREIDKNGYEIGLGLQFNINDNFSVSVGGLYGDMGVAPSYQSDFSYSNPSFTPGAGIMWKITDKLTLDAGVSDTFYQDEKVNFADPVVPSYDDVYGKTTLSFAAGISYSIF